MVRRALITSCLLAMMLSAAKTGPIAIEAPNYIMELYQCVRNKSPLNCYGVDADSVHSIDGNMVQTAMSDRPLQNESVTVGFNVTALIASPNNDSILAAKLRVYMDALSDEHILALRAAGCNTSTITLQLYAGEVVQANVTLTRDDLRTGKWVTFNGLAGVYRQWTTRNATSSVQSLAIVALGKCSARVLGFANRTHYSPKLVAFARSSVQSIGIITREVSEAVASRVQARGTVGSSSCQLHAYEVVTSELWSNYYEPPTFQANFCGGLCGVPDTTSALYATPHAQLQYFLNKQYPNQVPAPCCVPKDYTSVSFVYEENGSSGIKTINNLSAQSCQCR